MGTSGRFIINLRFTNDIDSLASSAEELKAPSEHTDRMAKSYGMKINVDKMKVVMNSTEGTGRDIKVNNTYTEVADQFKYLSW